MMYIGESLAALGSVLRGGIRTPSMANVPTYEARSKFQESGVLDHLRLCRWVKTRAASPLDKVFPHETAMAHRGKLDLKRAICSCPVTPELDTRLEN